MVKNEIEKFDEKELIEKIYNIRGFQVMLDSDLAELYGVETRRLNEQVKRNIDRFPAIFCFQLTVEEFENLMSQIATSSWGGYRKMPFVFTEQGVVMLSSVLRSEKAVIISIKIVEAFIEMRKIIQSNGFLFQRLDNLEVKQIETDKKVEKILDAMEYGEIKPKQGIYYENQAYDAYKFVYHFGASLKDLGKKWFGFSRMDVEAVEMLSRLGK